MIRILALSVALMALAPVAVGAADRPSQFFRELDTDGDGMVAPEEFTLGKGVIFYMLDGNHDLKIQRKETKLSPEQFAQYAGDDGTLDGGDFFNLPPARFSAFDRDGDRQISRDEFRKQVAEIRSGQQTAEGR
jgi:hypothetical protein